MASILDAMDGLPPSYDSPTASPPLYSPPGVPSPPHLPLPPAPSNNFDVQLVLEHRDIIKNEESGHLKPSKLRSEVNTRIRVDPNMCSEELQKRIYEAVKGTYYMDVLCCRQRAELLSTVFAPDLNEAGVHPKLKDGGWLKMALGLQRRADQNFLPVLRVQFGCGCRSCTDADHDDRTRDARRVRCQPVPRQHRPTPTPSTNHETRDLHESIEGHEYPDEWLLYMHQPEIRAERRRREHEQMRRMEDQRAMDRDAMWEEERRAQAREQDAMRAAARRLPFNERRRPAERASYEMLRAQARDAIWTLR